MLDPRRSPVIGPQKRAIRMATWSRPRKPKEVLCKEGGMKGNCQCTIDFTEMRIEKTSDHRARATPGSVWRRMTWDPAAKGAGLLASFFRSFGIEVSASSPRSFVIKMFSSV